jgi:hypothetical protein
MLIIRNSSPAPAPAMGGGDMPQPRMATKKNMPSKMGKGWGVLAGVAINTLSNLSAQGNATPPSTDNLNLTGMSFNVKGFYDYPISDRFQARFASGLETFTANGNTAYSDICGGTSCTLSVNYLTLEADAQVNVLSNSSVRVFVEGGFGFLVTLASSVNIATIQSVNATNQVILLGGGLDWKLSRTSYIPFVIEYGLFPSAGININSIYARAGYGMAF